jgi:hypothetical protein
VHSIFHPFTKYPLTKYLLTEANLFTKEPRRAVLMATGVAKGPHAARCAQRSPTPVLLHS